MWLLMMKASKDQYWASDFADMSDMMKVSEDLLTFLLKYGQHITEKNALSFISMVINVNSFFMLLVL